MHVDTEYAVLVGSQYHHSRLVFSGNSAVCVSTLNPYAGIVCGLPPHHTTLCQIRRKTTSTARYVDATNQCVEAHNPERLSFLCLA